jgi:hypothetical protein
MVLHNHRSCPSTLFDSKKAEPKARDYTKSFEKNLGMDLRLTYKRFEELYPFSQITYQEYKKLQMERAFKRAISSEKKNGKVKWAGPDLNR